MHFLALLLAASALTPDKPGVLAVLELRNKLKPADKESVDAGYFADVVRTTALQVAPGLKVMTRENMVVLLQATGTKLAECEGECEVDTGRRLGADLVVSGELLRIGKLYKLTLRMHDTHEGRLVSGAQASGASPEELDQNTAAAIKTLFAPLAQAKAPDYGLPAAAACATAAACNTEGGRRYTAQDQGGALPFYVRACELNDAGACVQVGWQLDRGEGIAKNLIGALAFYERSCDLGSAGGCNNAGVALRQGYGTAPDAEKALVRFRRACDLGDARACGSVGFAYDHGQGVAVDRAVAQKFLAKACDMNEGNSCTTLGYQHDQGIGVPADQQKANALYEKACKLDHGLGCMNFAVSFRDGRGVAKDPARARALFRRACELNEPSACAAGKEP